MLRKLGIALVADADRPSAGSTMTRAAVAAEVMRQLGVPVPESQRPAELGTVDKTELGRRTLRALGVNPIAGTSSVATVNLNTIGKQVLQGLGINPAAGAASHVTVSVTQIALRALRDIGVNPADAGAPGSGISWTYQQLATAALRRLAVVDADETPSSADQAYAEARAIAVHDMLVSLQYATWIPSAIPDAVSEAFIVLTANLLAPAFGKASSADVAAAAQEMVRKQALEGIYAQGRAENAVASVHDMLAGEGLTDWSVLSIPNEVSESYIALTAMRLAPIFGKQVPADSDTAAMAKIRRVVLSGSRGQSLAEARVTQIHEELVADGFAEWTLNAVPSAAADAYTELATQALAPVYGRKGDEAAREAAWGRLRKIAMSGARGQARAEEAVSAIHDDMNALGLIAWSVMAVPIAHAGDYVEAAAIRLAPAYGGKDAPEAYAATVERMRTKARIRGLQQRATDRVAAVGEELNALGMTDWQPDAIPAAVGEAYASMAAMLMQAENGKPLNPAEYAAWQARIRMVAMGGPAGQKLAEQKVRAVHYDWEARGKARWTLFDIPRYAEEPYVLLAAVLLAPECGVKADPAWTMGAEMALVRATALPSTREPVRAVYF